MVAGKEEFTKHSRDVAKRAIDTTKGKPINVRDHCTLRLGTVRSAAAKSA